MSGASDSPVASTSASASTTERGTSSGVHEFAEPDVEGEPGADHVEDRFRNVCVQVDFDCASPFFVFSADHEPTGKD